MKRFFSTALLTIAAAGLTFAEDAKPKAVTYTATMTGIVCSACKKKVRDSFTKKIGAIELQFAKGEKEGQQKVTFVSTKSGLTKDDAIKALAEFEDEFEVLALTPAPAAKSAATSAPQ